MKKLLFLICIFCVLKANAQNYRISFTGTGASGTVSTVKVENLTKGTELTVNESDILRLTTATGVNSIKANQSAEMKIDPDIRSSGCSLYAALQKPCFSHSITPLHIPKRSPLQSGSPFDRPGLAEGDALKQPARLFINARPLVTASRCKIKRAISNRVKKWIDDNVFYLNRSNNGVAKNV
jgi:hypothetical protein